MHTAALDGISLYSDYYFGEDAMSVANVDLIVCP